MVWTIKPAGIEPLDFVPSDKVVAYTTTIHGGVSEGPFNTLNLGEHVGDRDEHVASNRARLPYAQCIHWLNQTHSDKAIELPNTRQDADAAYSRQAEIACAVMTADCVPVLLADKDGNTVAAIHAGLQGLKNNIIRKTIVQAFQRVESQHIFAWIGPHIGACHYELPAAESEPFSAIADVDYPSHNPDKVMLDLGKIARFQLNQVGVQNIVEDGRCTYCEQQNLFSYRRSSHLGEANCGRMVSVIMKVSAV